MWGDRSGRSGSGVGVTVRKKGHQGRRNGWGRDGLDLECIEGCGWIELGDDRFLADMLENGAHPPVCARKEAEATKREECVLGIMPGCDNEQGLLSMGIT